MSHDVEASVQSVLDDFYLKPENISKLTSAYDDLESLVQLMHRGENLVTHHTKDREEFNQSNHVKKMDKHMRTLLDVKNDLKNTKTAINTITTRIHQGEKVKDVTIPYDAEISKLENEYSSKSEKDKYLTNSRYIAFRKHVWNVNHEDEEMPSLIEEENADGEIVMGRTKLSFKCPITTSWLETPLTNRLCKHSYSKSAIFQLIDLNQGSVNCPVSGCYKIVNRGVLEPDDMLTDQVRRAKEKANEESLRTEFYDVE